MKYEIEKNIPIEHYPRKYKYPFNEMAVGDSFIIGDYANGSLSKYSTTAKYFVKKYNLTWKFAVRKQLDGKVRIWRVK